jgi:hypothetical protein
MGPQEPKDVARDTARDLPAMVGELAALKGTLTNLYNQRPTWLENAHARLDAAVFAAYGWPPDLSDEEVFQNLLALNLERSCGDRS